MELDIREAEARAVAASEELSAQLRNDLQKMSNEVNEYKVRRSPVTGGGRGRGWGHVRLLMIAT